MTTDDYVAYIGIDWADRKHDIALYDCASGTWQESVIQTRPQDILDWVNQLRLRYGQGKIAVALEQKRGPLLYALCQYDNLVLFPINPRTVANYRKAFQPSRAKSDPVDARILVELMQKHPEKLERWVTGCPQIRALRQWVESRRMLVQEKVRLTNRITASLKSYFPQVLDWFEDKDTRLFCDFLQQFPDVKSAQAATSQQLTLFFRSHTVVRRTAITRRIQQIQDAGPPLTPDEAIVVPAQALTLALVALLKVIIQQLTRFNDTIAHLFEALPDAPLFAELPGAGPHLAPRLLVAFGEDRSRFTSAQAFMSYVGIAPVKEESGKKRWVHWRWSCPIFLRQTFVEWVNQARRFSAWSQAFYEQQKQAGKSHQKAIRSLAYKWGRILWRCWQDNTPYDEEKYVAALRQKQSPLVKRLAI
ncbi:IS110 family transposase [Phormidium sp. CLA17]|uniref:IS110 family transposase n=1 Tax=Leptolyngbya sp. Cla-17 TaxID=2803751 RepID=UPI00149093CC|nr:IS110 family transposase [Leptolyngbya sp. Cla-17]MBM0743389.1 IS110 family transposase [Leptolyngbya sp. Cla-17]MBM0743514.1 IS110 family transposase [Leptolyngbya sp. Cla-17]